ncbi:MAG: hypothetical protein IKM17_08795 [Lentisphaeria bacterium]|nr:hypothetical protein [Lentisphaeria bacterium]
MCGAQFSGRLCNCLIFFSVFLFTAFLIIFSRFPENDDRWLKHTEPECFLLFQVILIAKPHSQQLVEIIFFVCRFPDIDPFVERVKFVEDILSSVRAFQCGGRNMHLPASFLGRQWQWGSKQE